MSVKTCQVYKVLVFVAELANHDDRSTICAYRSQKPGFSEKPGFSALSVGR
jgi:hypothetical protein